MKKIIFLIIMMAWCSFDCFEYSEPIVENNLVQKSRLPEYGYISIPKIKLNYIFLNNNNVDKNIIVLKPSEYPNKEKSLLILAGHSGSGKYAYFNNLYKLKKEDKIYITYNNVKYLYSIVDIYYEKKDGDLKIYKFKDTKTLVLITCTNNNKNLQTIYVSKFIK